MGTQRLALVVACCVALLLVLLCVLRVVTPVMERDVLAHVKVDDYVGFNLDTDRLYFGTVAPGGSAQRPAYVYADDRYFVRVIAGEGLLGDWMNVLDNGFMLGPDERRGIPFQVVVPGGTDYGNYTVEVRIRFYRPMARLFYT